MGRSLSYRYAVVAAILFVAALRVHGALAWGVTAALIIAIRRAPGPGGAMRAGAFFGVLVAILGDAGWVVVAVHRYFSIPLPLAGAAVLFSALASGGVLGAALGIGLHAACAAREHWSVLLAASVWVTWERLLVAVVPHHPWVSLAATQTEQAAVLQVAALLGQEGLSFVVAAAGASIGTALHARSRRLASTGFLALGLGIVALCVLGGSLRLLGAAPVPAACSLATVDAGLESGEHASGATLELYESATRRALESPADAVVWPESALPGSPQLDLDLQRRLRDDARRWQTVLIAGGPRFGWARDWEPRAFNSVYRIDARGPLATYDKRALVPFAEIWPAMVPRPSSLALEEVVAGQAPAIFDVGGCRLGVLVCFEAEHANLARQLARAGANALLVVSNDAHLTPRAIELQLAQARLRAAESGLPVVRAANRGVSVSVDRFGRVEQRARGSSLHVAVSTGAPAPAVRFAESFQGLCGLLSALAAILAGWRRWRRNLNGNARAGVVEAVEVRRRT